MPAVLVLWAVAALLVAAALGVALHRARFASRAIYLISLAASLVILVAAGSHLLAGAPASPGVHLPVGLPWIGAHFRIDALSAFFLVVTSLGGAGASLFAIGYGEHEEAPGRVLPFYPAFLAGMNLVVLADDAFTFLVAWEFMSLSSWALVMAHHHDADNRAAGYIYIVMASFGTLTLLLAFGLLAGPDGGYTFAAIRRAEHAMPGLVLLLVLLGAGSKAGLVPLHVWLPLAHPAAPSHVSALMSGVMTKVAVYGFVRIVFDLLGSPGWWWSSIVLTRRRHHRRARRAQRPHAARPEAAARLSARSRISASSSSASGSRSPSRPTAWPPRRRSRSRRRCCTPSTTRCSRACCSSAPAPCSPPPASATSRSSAASSTPCRRPPSCSSAAVSPSPRCRRSTASSRSG